MFIGFNRTKNYNHNSAHDKNNNITSIIFKNFGSVESEGIVDGR